MKKFMAFATILVLMTIGGCKSNPMVGPKYQKIDTGTQVQPGIGFNEEHYIWENWIFPSFK